MKKIKQLKVAKKQIIKSNDGQLLLLAGIIISISIIAFASITAELSTNIGITIDKSSFLKSNYDNVRKEFGVALQDNLEGKLDYQKTTVENLVNLYFNDTRETFVFYVESLHSNYFDAEFLELTYNAGQINGLKAVLTLANEKEYISEVVTYELR